MKHKQDTLSCDNASIITAIPIIDLFCFAFPRRDGVLTLMTMAGGGSEASRKCEGGCAATRGGGWLDAIRFT